MELRKEAELILEHSETLYEHKDIISKLLLEITCLKVQVADRGNSYKRKAKENERLRSTLKEVSGCQTNHKTEKLCDGCLISISKALEEEA